MSHTQEPVRELKELLQQLFHCQTALQALQWLYMECTLRELQSLQTIFALVGYWNLVYAVDLVMDWRTDHTCDSAQITCDPISPAA